MKLGKIYISTFAVFLGAYILLMAVFSYVYTAEVKKQQVSKFYMTSYEVCSDINAFFVEWEENGSHSGTLLNKAGVLARQNDISYGIFTNDFKNTFKLPEGAACEYTALPKDSSESIRYIGYMDISRWVSEEDYKKIKEYEEFNNPNAGLKEIAYYHIYADGIWVDEMIVIPKRIIVQAMVVEAVAESGQSKGMVTSLSGGVTGRHVFSTTARDGDTKGLPFFPGTVWLNTLLKDDGELKEEVHSAALAKELSLKGQFPTKIINSGFMKLDVYSFFAADAKAEGESISGYVLGKKIDLWGLSAGVLLPVWLASLVIVLFAAWVTSYMSAKSEKERRSLESARRELTNGIAHDLKTPLAVISGYGEMLLENVCWEKRQHYAQSIVDTASSMDTMVCDMLEVSKLERPKLQLNKERLSLGALVNEVILEYEPKLTSSECTVEGDAEVFADRALMKRVIENFVSNAVKHRSEGGKIEIDISDRRLSVFNTGAPIPKKYLPDLWNAYTKTESQRGGGSGLGLYLAAQILKKHGFTYGAENKDGGVEFWVDF